MTVPALIGKAATLWRTYHDHGRAEAESTSARSMRFVVLEYPTLGINIRETISGWTTGAVELTGASNVRVTHVLEGARLVWNVTWR